MTVLDGGANVGFFSLLAGRLAGPQGRVISIEANPVTCELLRENLRRNSLGEPLQIALSSSEKEVELWAPSGWDVYSTLSRNDAIKEKRENSVSFIMQAKSLDALVTELNLSSVDFIKLDIEGAELDVLRSGRETLRRFRPLLTMEYGAKTWANFGASFEEFQQLMTELNYKVWKYNWQYGFPQPLPPETRSAIYTNLLLAPSECDILSTNKGK